MQKPEYKQFCVNKIIQLNNLNEDIEFLEVIRKSRDLRIKLNSKYKTVPIRNHNVNQKYKGNVCYPM
jgi:hypothetical protein